jgi:hypothetical protein
MDIAAHPIDFMRARYVNVRNAPKILARLSGMAPRTCGKWLRAEGGPSAEALMNLAKNDPEFRANLIEWLETQ